MRRRSLTHRYCPRLATCCPLACRDLLRRVLCGLKEAAFFNWRLAAEESIYERQSQVSPPAP